MRVFVDAARKYVRLCESVLDIMCEHLNGERDHSLMV